MMTKPFKLTVKSQVTIPERVKVALGISPGDAISFNIHNGHVEIIPAQDKKVSLFDLGKKYRTPPQEKVTVEEMNKAIQDGYKKLAQRGK